MRTKRNIGIIGAGIGGLSAAVHLAEKGFKVSVFEQNDYAGGKAGNYYKDGFRFDTGPSLLTMPFILKDLFKLHNENIEEYLTISRLRVICKYFYPDGKIINAYSNPDEFAEEIESKTSDNISSVKEYLNYCRNIYELTTELFLFSPEINLRTFLNPKFYRSFIKIKRIDPFRTTHKANQSYFKDPKTIQLFDRYATYNGSNPYRAPATLNIIPYVELSLGGYIVEEGIYAIPEALKKLGEKKGVDFYLNHKVEKLLTKNEEVLGLKSNNNDYFFDSVISNIDIGYTHKYLLENSLSDKNEPSLSGIVYYWGIKGNHPSLETHNIIFSANYKKEFDDIFLHKKCPDDPTVYIYISSKFKKDDAPEGFENWFVMVNAPYNIGQDWNSDIDKVRTVIKQKIKDVLGIDLSMKIVIEEVMSPPDIETRTGSLHGSIYGSSSNSKAAAFRRYSVKSKSNRNLYFCGGSVHPGGGIPLVLLSGKHVAEIIKREAK